MVVVNRSYVPPTIINFRTDKQRFSAAKVMQVFFYSDALHDVSVFSRWKSSDLLFRSVITTTSQNVWTL